MKKMTTTQMLWMLFFLISIGAALAQIVDLMQENRGQDVLIGQLRLEKAFTIAIDARAMDKLALDRATYKAGLESAVRELKQVKQERTKLQDQLVKREQELEQERARTSELAARLDESREMYRVALVQINELSGKLKNRTRQIRNARIILGRLVGALSALGLSKQEIRMVRYHGKKRLPARLITPVSSKQQRVVQEKRVVASVHTANVAQAPADFAIGDAEVIRAEKRMKRIWSAADSVERTLAKAERSLGEHIVQMPAVQSTSTAMPVKTVRSLYSVKRELRTLRGQLDQFAACTLVQSPAAVTGLKRLTRRYRTKIGAVRKELRQTRKAAKRLQRENKRLRQTLETERKKREKRKKQKKGARSSGSEQWERAGSTRSGPSIDTSTLTISHAVPGTNEDDVGKQHAYQWQRNVVKYVLPANDPKNRWEMRCTRRMTKRSCHLPIPTIL